MIADGERLGLEIVAHVLDEALALRVSGQIVLGLGPLRRFLDERERHRRRAVRMMNDEPELLHLVVLFRALGDLDDGLVLDGERGGIGGLEGISRRNQTKAGLVYQAIANDPLSAAVLSLEEIRSMTRELFAASRDHLPQFKSVEI